MYVAAELCVFSTLRKKTGTDGEVPVLIESDVLKEFLAFGLILAVLRERDNMSNSVKEVPG